MSGSERIRFLVILSAEPGQIPRASEQIARELSRKFGGGATVMGGGRIVPGSPVTGLKMAMPSKANTMARFTRSPCSRHADGATGRRGPAFAESGMP